MYEDRKNNCSCTSCANMCKNSPCFPTPRDVINLIKKGYKNRLSYTIYVDQRTMLWYEIVAPIGLEIGGFMNQCNFLKDSLCELHDLNLKPEEGRILNHNDKDNADIRVKILESWNNAEGEQIIEEFKNNDSDIIMLMRFKILGINKGFI